jgi:hypothetical protein
MQFKELGGTLWLHVNIESTGNAASTGNLPLAQFPLDAVIDALVITPSAAVTADGTNNAVYTFTRHTAGASAATVATRTWASGNSVALTPETLTLSATAANLVMTAGDTLTAVKTAGGTGLVIPNMLVRIAFHLTGV